MDFTGHLMDLVLVFMGSSERVRNPHLRAKLAEVLAELMPKQDDTSMSMQLYVASEMLDFFKYSCLWKKKLCLYQTTC